MQRAFGPGGPSKLWIKAIVSVIRLRAELEKADTKAMSAATQPNEAEEERTAIAANARATGVTVENSQYQHIRRQPSLPYQWKHYYKVRKWEWISDPCSRTLNWISSRMIYRNWRRKTEFTQLVAESATSAFLEAVKKFDEKKSELEAYQEQ